MIQAVKMEYIDEHGMTITSSVSDYYDNFIAACRPFATQPNWPTNTIVIFVTNLTPDIKDELESKHANYNQGVTLANISQFKHLAIVCNYAITMEKKLLSLTKIIHKAAAPITLHSNPIDSAAYSSVAERTRTQYSDKEGGFTQYAPRPL